jgi:hypothetical protein
LRERLIATAKSKHGDAWACLRRAAQGERMFRLVGGPGDPSLPVVAGVDEFVSKSLLWSLAGAVSPTGDPWSRTAPEDIAALLDPSFSHLRADCRTLGHESKFTAEHVAAKWAPACAKHLAEQAQAEAFVARMTETGQEAAQSAAQGLPLVLQLDNAYLVLDDRNPARPIYQGPTGSSAVVALARQLWADTARVLDVPKANGAGTRAMNAADLIQAYGRSITSLVTELAATAPRVEDLTLIRPAINAEPPPPAHDPATEAWLATLAGPDLPALIQWISFAAPKHLAGGSPALTMIGGTHVGKTLLANGVAAAAGLPSCAKLAQGLGKFGAVIQTNPYLLADEGLPTGPHGKPMTEEFRDLAMRANHSLELKGLNTNVTVLGGVRIVLAANKIDRLFSNRGTLSADDVAALIRRLLVIEITDPGRIARAQAQAQALGGFELDPARLARVAGHIRWIQENHPATRAPEPSGGTLRAELRRGGDIAGAALRALEDASANGAAWIAIDPSPYPGVPGGIVWIQPDPWSRACAATSAVIARALAPYIVRPNAQYRRHPITGTRENTDPPRTRWIGLDFAGLTADGVMLEPPPTPKDKE